MLIEIAETHPPQNGKKVGAVIAKDGQRFEIWPEKLAGIVVGKSYEVTVADRDFNGRTIRKILKATPAASNGATTRVAPTPVTGTESDFVGRALAALIAVGAVANDKRQLYEATLMLRGLWGATFGAQQNGGAA